MYFSVVIPVYNVENYLQECVNSILSQSFKDFEVILVNDGSKDKSGMICDELASKDSRVKVIHKKNEGQAIARNVGIDISKGKYLIFIDSDDFVLDKQFLKKIYDISYEKNADIVCYKFQKYFDKDKILSKCKFDLPIFEKHDKYEDRLLNLIENDSFYCSPWSKAIKREIILQSKFEPGLLSEDQDWYYKVLLKSSSIEGINESFIAYRQRSNSTSVSWTIKNLTDTINIIDYWKTKFSDNKPLSKVLINSLAKLYCNLLIGYTRYDSQEKKNYEKDLKQLSDLIKHNKNPRVKVFNMVYRIGGFNLVMFLLNIIQKVRKV